MSKKQYQPFYWGDYLRDTQQLTLHEHGVYMRLIGEYWNTGQPLPNDMKRLFLALTAITPEDQEAVRFVLNRYFKLDGNVWRQAKIDQTLAEHAEHAEKSHQRAKAAADARWNASGNAPSIASGMPTTPPHPTPPLGKNNTTPNPVGGVGEGAFQNEKKGGGFQIVHRLSEDGLLAAKRAAPDWDIYYLAAIYDKNINEHGVVPPDKPDKAFAAYCKRFAQRKAG